MAVLNFSITIADADVPVTAEAMKSYFNNPAMSDAEAVEALRQQNIARLKEIVVAYRRKQAVDAAEAANYDISVT